VAHRLHAAGEDDVVVAGANRLGREGHRLEAGAAHLVDRESRDGDRQPSLEGRLAGGVLPDAGGDDVPHDDVLDVLRRHTGALQGLLQDHSAERRSGEPLESSEELSDRGSRRRDDHRFAHHDLRHRNVGGYHN
jgi:hypothetical protein